MPENNNEGDEKHQEFVEHSPNKSEEEMQVNKIEQESRADEVHDGESDDSMIGDDNIDAAYMDDDHDGTMKMPDNNNEEDYTRDEKHQELVELTPVKAEDHNTETLKNEVEDTKMDEGYESGTEEDQEIFMKELEAMHMEKNLEFKPLKFYGQPLNCLKLWRSVIKLGGYDQHFDRRAQYDIALAKIEEAMQHTKLFIYTLSRSAYDSKLLKHAGDFTAAAALADEARCMDLADRYVNSRCVERMLQADQVQTSKYAICLYQFG
ncbi:uncharacterized protein LOC143620898 [Bidens hawaiensis]|uniref:uncharacterized protein LOC143620898 n=1 Tax=Bidens hawaiensis TaxID=980011 RepID=UPI00404AB6EE